jgi:hypothetical protein
MRRSYPEQPVLYRRKVGVVQARERQMAENEIRFRALNERLRDGSGTWGPGEGTFELVCECGDENCTRAIQLTPREYEGVRADEAQFAVVPGHERSDVEDIVGEHGDWIVVRKRGEAAVIAADTDPRAPSG